LLVMDLRALSYFVAVAEERNFGRAAARLHMTQPPLSRAIRQLEADLGTVLLDRSSNPVTLTSAGTALYDEARLLLEQAEHVRARVAAAAGTATITIGILADSAEQAGTRLAAAFRHRHPAVQVGFREADFTDPTAGLRAGRLAWRRSWRSSGRVLRVEAADAGLDPFLSRPVGVPLNHQRPYFLGDLRLVDRRVPPPPGLVAQLIQVAADIGQQLAAADIAVAGHDDPGVLVDEPLHHRDPSHPRHVGVVGREPGEDRELAGLHQIAGEHHPGVGDRHHLIALGMALAGGPQADDPAAEVEIA
jgi:DNA-binding transcriptional LysR family regulator